MPSTKLARAALAAAAVCALAALPACSRTVAASYPGGHVVEYPWRACGMYCDQAFVEIEATHDPTGKACEELVTKAESDAAGGGDPRASAAALYDSAIVLTLRGRPADAAERFARAEALDADPDYKDLDRLSQESARQYPVTPLPLPAPPVLAPAASSDSAPAAGPGPGPGPGPAPAPAAAPAPPAVSAPAVAPAPTPAASASPAASGALTTPR
jgi:hypothetical protein